ncbi:MAG: MFS transporter [Rhodospirillaceae bacterium]|nr:MFS transporter [Rhodospirillaceae bacterium]MBT6429390.1 MFS transporter [Rhodospirillaceae bacterium]MBT7756891.1 MFS transporter [Rhodospirillaceae bacterium]
MSDTGTRAEVTVTPLTLIRDGNFRRIWIAGALGWMMRWLEMLAIGVFTFEVTQSALMVALITMARTVPMLLLGAFTGAIADGFDRRVMLLVGMATLALTSAVLAVLAITDQIELWHVALGMFISGLYGTLEFPVRRAMLGIIASTKAGTAGAGVALTLDSATNHCMRLIGPALGGLVLTQFGLPGVYVLGVVLFGLGFILVWTAEYHAPHHGTGAPRILGQIIEGLSYIRTNPVLMGTLYVTMVMNICGFPYGAMVPVIGGQVLGQGAVATGLLLSADAAGGLLGALFIANLARPRHYSSIYFYGSIFFLGALVAFSFSRDYALSLGLLFLAGLGVAGFAAMQSTIIFTAAPPEMRGRLMGVLAVCIGVSPSGILQVGLLADWFGGAMAVGIIAVEGLAALAVAALVWPHFRRRKSTF